MIHRNADVVGSTPTRSNGCLFACYFTWNLMALLIHTDSTLERVEIILSPHPRANAIN